MKLLNVSSLLLLVVQVVSSSNVFDSWSADDLKQYLNDHSVEYDDIVDGSKDSLEKLKSLANDNIEELKLRYECSRAGSSSSYSPKCLKLKAKDIISGRSSSSSSLFSGYDLPDYSDVKKWSFQTWDDSELKKLLKKVSYSGDYKDLTHDELVKAVQDNYDAIAKKFAKTGKYPSDWLYSNWSKKSLRKWLDDHDVSYSKLRDSDDDLRRLVRENAYNAYKVYEEERDSVLDSLDLTNKSLYEKGGELKDDIFNSWTSSQLYNWLKSHGVELEDSVKTNQAELVETAKKYKSSLGDDISYWVEKASKKVSPILSKGREKVDNVINDTFLVGIESWSRDRLKEFLQLRDVPIPLFATKSKLIELVKANKLKPIKNFNKDYLFKGWSNENIAEWIKQHGNDNYQSLKDFLSSTSQTISDEGSNLQKTLFQYWNDVDLKNYLESFGVKNTKNLKHDELITLAQDNLNWFIGDVSNTGSYYGSSFLNKLKYYIKRGYSAIYYSIFK